ncbi:MAG: flagellar type III secretion system pore protein FliP [Janthinobacterium lividum]
MSFTVVRRGAAGTGPSLFVERAPARALPWMRIALALAALILMLGIALPAMAQTRGRPATSIAAAASAGQSPTPGPGVGDAVDKALGQLGGAQSGATGQAAPLSLSLQVLIIMGLLTILPGILLMMTSFTRIVIVLSVLRQAMGLQQTPPNQVLIGLALFLSFFVMAPTINQINATAIQPYAAGKLAGTQMIETAGVPLHAFMAKQTRVKDVTLFAGLAKSGPYRSQADIPFSVLLPAFVTSELKTAFQIGFLIFLPFIVVDLVVATVLTSLGMMMMSPTIISMPFKLLLFVLVDGWALTMGSLAQSFG